MYNFLIYIAQPYSIPIGKPLEEEIKKRGFQIKWFVEIEATKSKLLNNEEILHTVDDVINYKPDVILVAANEVPHFFPEIKVQVFHGFSVNKRSKDKGHFRIRGFFDLYCTQGPSTTTYFKQLEKKYGHFKVVETGWSKVDILFPKVEKSSTEKPTIFLASTFTTSLSLAHQDDVYTEIERLIKTNEWNWIINLHPKMDAEIVTKFKKLTQYNNVKYIPFLESLAPLKNADVLVADTSSIITEFIIQEKPVITYRNNKPFPYFINTLQATDLEANIKLALQKPSDLMQKIHAFIMQEHPYFDGKSSKRVIDACIAFIENKTGLSLQRKPLNLLRKYQMRKKFNYFKNFFKRN